MAKNMVEAEQSLGSSRKKKTSASETAIKVVKTIAEATGILPKREAHISKHGVELRKSPTVLIEERAIKRRSEMEQEKVRWAKEVVVGLQRGKPPPELKSQTTITDAQATIRKAQAKVGWLVARGETPQYEPVAQVIAEIAQSNLSDNPDLLLAKGAQLRWSLTDKTPRELDVEARKYLRRIHKKALDLYGIPEPRFEGNKLIHDLTEEQRDMFNIIGHNLTGYESGMIPTSGSGADPSVEIPRSAGTDSAYDRLLESLERMTGGKILHTDDAVAASREISRVLARGGMPNAEGKDFKAFTPEDIKNMQQKRFDILNFEIQRRGGAERLFSSLYLSEKEIRDIIENPALFFEYKLREIEKSGAQDVQSMILKGELHRLELAGEFFASGQFDESQIQLDPSITDEKKRERLLAQLVETLRGGGYDKEDKHLLAEMVNARIDGLFAVKTLATMDDPKKFAETMKRIGDRGVNLPQASNGKLVGEWKGRLERNYREIANIPDEEAVMRYMPEAMTMAEELTARQLAEEAGLWEEQYKDFFRRFARDKKSLPSHVRLTNPSGTPDNIAKTACASIVRLSSFAFRLEMRKAQVMATGLPPGVADFRGEGSSFLTANIEESMNKVYLFRDWFIRKWTNFVPARLAVWNTGARFYAEMNPEIRARVVERTQELWQALRDPDNVIKKKAREEIRFLVKMNEPADANELRFLNELDETKPNYNPKSALEFERILRNKKKIEDYVALEEGGYRMQNFLKPYSQFDSGWRENTYSSVLTEAYEHGDKLLLARKIRQKAVALFGAQKHHKEDLREDLKSALGEVAQYRPQALIEFLYLGGNDSVQLGTSNRFREWFKANKAHLGGFELPHQLLHAVNRRFLMINGRLLAEGMAPIDYSEALTGEQKDIVESVFKIGLRSDKYVEINDQKLYLGIMDEFYKHLTKDGRGSLATKVDGVLQVKNAVQLHELTNIRYDRFYSAIPWIDDLPIGYLEDPAGLKNIKSGYKKYESGRYIEISKRLTEQGRGPGSPLGRAHGDFAVAAEAFAMLQSAHSFTPDEKYFMDTFQKVWEFISIYSGNELGASAAIALAASFEGAAQVKSGYGAALTWMADSSIFKEWFGDNAPSWALDKVAEFKEQLELYNGRLSTVAPLAAEWLEEYLNISTINIFGAKISWNRIFEKTPWLAEALDKAEDIPVLGNILNQRTLKKIERLFPIGLTAFKTRTAIAFAAIIIALFAVDQAKKGGEEARH